MNSKATIITMYEAMIEHYPFYESMRINNVQCPPKVWRQSYKNSSVIAYTFVSELEKK